MLKTNPITFKNLLCCKKDNLHYQHFYFPYHSNKCIHYILIIENWNKKHILVLHNMRAKLAMQTYKTMEFTFMMFTQIMLVHFC